MANVFDSNDDVFVVSPLRTQDAAYAAGAVRGNVGRPPQPIAFARGPLEVGGPSGAVGAGEQWCVGYTMPARPDLVWVLVQADPLVRWGDTANEVVGVYYRPIGDPASHSVTRAPVYGPGSNITVLYCASASFLYAAAADVPGPASVWCPLDPNLTVDGFQGVMHVVANGAAGIAANGLRCKLDHVRYLGYPINAWSTGDLASHYQTRGS